ncbi:hypothetical protein SAMN06298216_1010 [Spirosomataceae bacterium TFI 002]|nr:hypothetical protein SAMN06298216_1010 [Spirosomataceae bacterium TFI 002]
MGEPNVKKEAYMKYILMLLAEKLSFSPNLEQTPKRLLSTKYLYLLIFNLEVCT